MGLAICPISCFVVVLTERCIPRKYWCALKKKMAIEGSEVYEKIERLKILADDGK